MTPTQEQLAIIEATKSRKESLLIKAYAGTGKTKALELISGLIEEPLLALAFNKSTKLELEKRFKPGTKIYTFNGLGLLAVNKMLGKFCKVDDKKLGRIVSQVFKEINYRGEEEDWFLVRSLASKAMMSGLVPSSIKGVRGLIEDTEETWKDLLFDQGAANLELAKLAREVVIKNIKEGLSGTISFDDQIYLSTLFGGQFPRFGNVLVDESQDLNILNHIQVKKCAAGRLFVVGDQRQSIYAFRGADFESISKLKTLRQDWIELPLTVTFRCPKVVVARQQEHAPGFKAFETNLEGEIIDWRATPASRERWNGRKLLGIDPNPTILCRNNAPLVKMAFRLIREGIGAYMLGREIGKGLESLSKTILKDETMPRDQCIARVNAWLSDETLLAQKNNQRGKIASLEDRAWCLLAILESEYVTNARDLRRQLKALFSKDSGTITLSTGHKAKGLEWKTVLFLDSYLLPSRWAQEGPELEQEKNLKYVIETRAQERLILADSADYEPEGKKL